MPSRRWNNLTKIIVVALLVILAIVTVFAFRAVIPATIIAFFLAFILGYPVNWIQQRTGWARGPAVLALYLLLLLIIALVTVLVIPRITGLVMSLEQTIEELILSLQQLSIPIGDRTLHAGDFFEPLSGALQNIFSATTVDPMSIFRGVTNGILISIYVLVLNFWLLKDLQQLQRLMMEQIPADYQEDVRRLSHEIGQIWEGFLRGQLALGVVIGVMTWIPLMIVGVANAGALSLLAGLMELLPAIGQGISGTVAVLVALFQGSTWMNVSPVTFALIIFAIYSVIANLKTSTSSRAWSGAGSTYTLPSPSSVRLGGRWRLGHWACCWQRQWWPARVRWCSMPIANCLTRIPLNRPAILAQCAFAAWLVGVRLKRWSLISTAR